MDDRKLRIFLGHRTALAGIAILVLITLAAGLVGLVSPYDSDAFGQVEESLGPSSEAWLGSDVSGRDTLTRLLFGARLSLFIGITAVAFSMVIGIPLGAIAGYFGGWPDMVISRLVDLMLSFPSILLAICIAAAMGIGLDTVIIAVGVVGVPQFARQVRASVLQIKELEFVMASRALGASHFRILSREIMPHAMGPIIVLATLGIGTSILTAAGLSFLGLGVETGTAEWGALLKDGYTTRSKTIWVSVWSGLAISVTVLAFNLVGDGLRDAYDPRSRVT